MKKGITNLNNNDGDTVDGEIIYRGNPKLESMWNWKK